MQPAVTRFVGFCGEFHIYFIRRLPAAWLKKTGNSIVERTQVSYHLTK
jgi:hypothetical protein